MTNSASWMQGTVLLAALLERFAPGQVVTITRNEIDEMNFGTQLPVMFRMDPEHPLEVQMQVVRPGHLPRGALTPSCT